MLSFFSLDTLLGIGGIIFATAYAWERLRSGGKQADADLIVSLTNNLKAQKEINDTLNDQMKQLQGQILLLQQQVGKLQGINEANDKKTKEYIEIIANRNPELEKTLTQIEELIRQVVPFMDDVRSWHASIRTSMDRLEKEVNVKPRKRKDV